MTKAIKVRIALCVDNEGNYAASGYPTRAGYENTPFDYLNDNLTETVRRYWVEVEVPVPDAEPPTVQGKATEVQP